MGKTGENREIASLDAKRSKIDILIEIPLGLQPYPQVRWLDPPPTPTIFLGGGWSPRVHTCNIEWSCLFEAGRRRKIEAFHASQRPPYNAAQFQGVERAGWSEQPGSLLLQAAEAASAISSGDISDSLD